MKKNAIIALALAVTLCFAGCGRNKPEESQATEPATTAPITVPSMPEMTMPSENIPDPTVDSNSGNNPTEDTAK